MHKRGFRSDILRTMYKEAVQQGWRPEGSKRSGHVYVCCPKEDCHFREAFSMSGRGHRHELAMKLNIMRKHGFTWQGRGGTHTAQPLGSER